MRDHHENFQGHAAPIDQTVHLPSHQGRTLQRVVLLCIILCAIGVVDATNPNFWQVLAQKFAAYSQSLPAV